MSKKQNTKLENYNMSSMTNNRPIDPEETSKIIKTEDPNPEAKEIHHPEPHPIHLCQEDLGQEKLCLISNLMSDRATLPQNQNKAITQKPQVYSLKLLHLNMRK